MLMILVMVKDTYVTYAWDCWYWRPSYIDENNDSEQLYEWVLLENDRTDISTLVNPSYTSWGTNYYRMLLFFEKKYYRMVGDIPVYDHSEYYYYQADPSRWVRNGENGDNYGKSMIDASKTPQVKLGEKRFITRGGLQAFYVERTGKCTWKDSDYRDDYQYRMHPCSPGTDKIYSDVSVWWTDGSGYDDIWYYDKKGEPVGNVGSTEQWKNSKWFKKGYDSDSVYDKWTLSKTGMKSCGWPAFTFTAADLKSQDPHFGMWWFEECPSFSASDNLLWDNPTVQFAVYVGGPVGQKMKTNSGDTVKINYVDAITDPYLIKRNQKYVIEGGGVLFINDTLVIHGEIVNRGLIIVGNDGCIIELDDETSSQKITLEGGDLIVKKGGYISVDELISKDLDGRCPQIVNYGNILAEDKLSLKNTIVDNSGELFGGWWVDSAVLVKKDVSKQRELNDQRARLIDSFSLGDARKHNVNWYQYTSDSNMFIGSKIVHKN